MSTTGSPRQQSDGDALGERASRSALGDGASTVMEQWRESAARAAGRAYEAAYGREIPDASTSLRWTLNPRVAVTVALVLALAAAALAWSHLGGAGATPLADSVPGASQDPDVLTAGSPVPQDAAAPDGGALLVHVSGAVVDPGLVEVSPGSRVLDAIDAAGGLTQEADQAGVNLARPAVDGEHIHVPGIDDPSSSGGEGGSVALNSAPAEELEDLPGIGPVLAQRIVEDRDAHGSFLSLDDLQRVSGVGPALVARWEGLAHV